MLPRFQLMTEVVPYWEYYPSTHLNWSNQMIFAKLVQKLEVSKLLWALGPNEGALLPQL